MSWDRKPEELGEIDWRFPNTQQTRHCWTRYNEFLLCSNKYNPHHETCTRLKALAMNSCPIGWISEWEQNRREGKFYGVKSEAVFFKEEEEE